MTYDVSSQDSQEKATATGTYHGKHFKLVAVAIPLVVCMSCTSM
jgi:hypothetical protein